MSWVTAVKNALDKFGITVENTARGNIIVRPNDVKSLEILILTRRLQYSLDRKLEIIGIWDLPSENRNLKELQSQFFNMLANSVEIEFKGFFKRKVKVKEWSELLHISKTLKNISSNKKLKDFIEMNENIKKEIINSGAELIEIFPRMISSKYLELYFILMGKIFTLELVKDYINNLKNNAWIIRLHLLYGTPRMSKKIKNSYLLIKNFTKLKFKIV